MYNKEKDEYIEDAYQMICGSSEAEKRQYHAALTEGGQWWLWADQPNAADNVYCGYTQDTGSRGFAGRRLSFELVNGNTVTLQGPWHTNQRALYAATGVDIRDRHLTFVVVAKTRETIGSYGQSRYTGILYIDEEPTIGTFNRGREIAQKIANDIGEAVFLYSKSMGGSSSDLVHPENKEGKDNE